MVALGWLVRKTLGMALQPTTGCSRTPSTTILDHARRARVNTTPQHTYPLTNPISLCQSGYQVIKEGVLPIDAFWHGAKECINSPLSDRDLLPGVVGPGLRKPLWQDRPCTTCAYSHQNFQISPSSWFIQEAKISMCVFGKQGCLTRSGPLRVRGHFKHATLCIVTILWFNTRCPLWRPYHFCMCIYSTWY